MRVLRQGSDSVPIQARQPTLDQALQWWRKANGCGRRSASTCARCGPSSSPRKAGPAAPPSSPGACWRTWTICRAARPAAGRSSRASCSPSPPCSGSSLGAAVYAARLEEAGGASLAPPRSRGGRQRALVQEREGPRPARPHLRPASRRTDAQGHRAADPGRRFPVACRGRPQSRFLGALPRQVLEPRRPDLLPREVLGAALRRPVRRSPPQAGSVGAGASVVVAGARGRQMAAAAAVQRHVDHDRPAHHDVDAASAVPVAGRRGQRAAGPAHRRSRVPRRLRYLRPDVPPPGAPGYGSVLVHPSRQ